MAAEQMAGTVHINSAWLGPAELMGSLTWTYNDPAGVPFMRHSTPERAPGELIDNVAAQLREAAVSDDFSRIRDHIFALRDVSESKFPDIKLPPSFAESFAELDGDSLAVVKAVATVRQAAARVGAAWAPLVEAHYPPDPKALQPQTIRKSLYQSLFDPRDA